MKPLPIFYILSVLFASSSYKLIAQNNTNSCSTPIILCNTSPIQVDQIPTTEQSSDYFPTCFSETEPVLDHSIWLKWKILSEGDLSFTIVPFSEHDDIDFVLYKSIDGTCGQMNMLRCMRSGPDLGTAQDSTYHCVGATGLSGYQLSSNQTSRGCEQSNFLNAVETTEGETYYLLITNYHSNAGFLLEFNGNIQFDPSIGGCETGSLSQPKSPRNVIIHSTYPNPVEEYLHVSLTSLTNTSSYFQIISSKGELIQSIGLEISVGTSEYIVPASNLPQGVYFIKIHTPEYTAIERFFKR